MGFHFQRRYMSRETQRNIKINESEPTRGRERKKHLSSALGKEADALSRQGQNEAFVCH